MPVVRRGPGAVGARSAEGAAGRAGAGAAAAPAVPVRGVRVDSRALPVFALLRRADLAEVIGAALAAKAVGKGVRPIAAAMGRAAGTVRGWLRRFGSRAEAVRVFFTGLLVEAGTDPVPPAAGPSPFADAVAAVAGAAVAVSRGGRASAR